MKTSVSILFKHLIGKMDDENSTSNGVKVTLSRWETPDQFSLPRHYILHSQVMINGEMEVDTKKIIINNGWQSDAFEIRRAISTMDELMNSHPALDVLEGERI